jgi:hypothetical protein
MDSKEHSTFIGIDVARDRLDVHVLPGGKAFSVARDKKGLATLIRRIRKYDAPLVCLEATGGYEREAVLALAAAGIPVVVMNPRQIRDFARATGCLAKTDRLDAEVIAAFAEAVRHPFALYQVRRNASFPGSHAGADRSSPCWRRRKDSSNGKAIRPSKHASVPISPCWKENGMNWRAR